MTIPIWIAFLVFVVTMVALDLGVFHRKDPIITLRSAQTNSCSQLFSPRLAALDDPTLPVR